MIEILDDTLAYGNVVFGFGRLGASTPYRLHQGDIWYRCGKSHLPGHPGLSSYRPDGWRENWEGYQEAEMGPALFDLCDMLLQLLRAHKLLNRIFTWLNGLIRNKRRSPFFWSDWHSRVHWVKTCCLLSASRENAGVGRGTLTTWRYGCCSLICQARMIISARDEGGNFSSSSLSSTW